MSAQFFTLILFPVARGTLQERRTVLDISSRRLIVLLSFLMVREANSAPILGDLSAGITSVLSPVSDVLVSTVRTISEFNQTCNSWLAMVSAEFNMPPVSLVASPDPPIHAKSLPVVPGSLLMSLTGFLCVSLVKDSKVWLAGFAGLLWLGHVSFPTLSQSCSYLYSRKQIEQRSHLNCSRVCELEDSSRLRSDLESTRYMGLLHRLAGIPDVNSNWPAVTLEQIYGFNALFKCLDSRAKKFIILNPSFVFFNNTRGPPLLG